MNLSEIHAAIPHRPPFLFIDEIVERSTERIRCRRTFRPDEFYFAGHYPHFALVPGVLLCEAALQAGAVLVGGHVKADADRVPVATRMNDVKFKRMVRPGETVEVVVELTERLADAFFLTGQVSCDGKLAARLDFAVAVVAGGGQGAGSNSQESGVRSQESGVRSQELNEPTADF